eukprot:scaffold13752_cov122-Isochrysis_galbana.AAC.2
MAPRQLRLEPIEVDMTADKGVKRVRVDSTEESSTQVQLPARATAWGGELHKCVNEWFVRIHSHPADGDVAKWEIKMD